MKVYLKTPCPCGSGKPYGKCCIKKSDPNISIIDGNTVIDYELSDATFTVNRKGAVVFLDEARQPVLTLPEGITVLKVLSVGFSKTRKPMATIKEEEGAICYMLPDWFAGWCMTCVGMSHNGINLFPAEVAFGNIKGKYTADII